MRTWLLLTHVGISTLSWLQLIFSMNRYVLPCQFQTCDLWALLLFSEAALLRWATALATRNGDLWIQLAFAGASAVLGWASFVVVFNEGFTRASRQQGFALVFSFLVTLLFEVSNFIIIS